MRQRTLYLFMARTFCSRMVCVCGLAILAAARVLAADRSGVTVAPPGDWVLPQFFGQTVAVEAPSDAGDERLLLADRQISASQKETFVHLAVQVRTLAGVQKDATLKIEFDPSYETVTLHWARVWRGRQHFDQLDTNRVKVVQPESEVDTSILNGVKSVLLVMDDVRVGDAIDYAYSRKGRNPVFGDHFACDIPVEMSAPADRLVTRLVWPKGRPLYARPHGCTVQPRLMPGKDMLEYAWDLRQVPAVPFEDSLPLWCDPQPWVQLSEFKTWSEVNQWALALFQINQPFSPALARQVADWRKIPDPEQQVEAALRFVQEQVRYFGIEMGVSGQKPADPSVVFWRRFGDCKDKALLFVSILRALGIEAYPVLVNAGQGRAIENWLPSAEAFDHCIALAQFGGRTYWLDATMNYQRGPLEAHYLPPYERGLVIAPRTSGLSVIPRASGATRTTTSEYFHLRGKTEPAELQVVTVAEGRDAESLRQLFAETKRSDIEKNYTHAYSELYPGIKMSSPVELTDDEVQNRVQTTQYYVINQAWTALERGRKYRCDFYASALAAELRAPVDKERKWPLGIGFPEHRLLRTEVILPEAWPAESERKFINDPAFSFQKASRLSGNKLVMEYEYQSLGDVVAPDQMARYLENINQCSQLLTDSLTWR